MAKLNKKKIINISTFVVISVAIFFAISTLFKTNLYNTNVSTNTYQLGGSGRGSETGTRLTYNFNYGWTFSKGTGTLASESSNSVTDPCLSNGVITYIPDPIEGTSDVKDIPYNTSYDPTNYNSCMNNTWKEVSLPHTYNDEDTFNNFMETGQNGERSMYAGTAWYKKSFNLDASYATGKKIIVEFEAARQAAKVWINGHLLDGTYQNGFIAFGYELPTEYLNFGEGSENANVITVMTDNSYPYRMEVGGTTTSSVVSWHNSHWQPNYGGLYRNSYLYVVDDLHLTIPLYSFTEGVGTYIYTDNETNSSAQVHIDAEVENGSDSSKTFYYRAIVKDMEGNTALTINGPNTGVTLDAGSKITLEMSDILDAYQVDGETIPIKFWSTKYPYLYTVEVELLDSENNIIDNNLNTLGVRTFRFTTDSGFYLNENSLILDGWGQKSTWEWAAVGASYPDWMTEYGFTLMKDAGANYLRFGHTSGSGTQISMADKYGLIVTQPGVDGEGTSEGGVYDANTYRLRIEAMRDMIINLRNHPSILLWEIGNQSSGIGNSYSNGFLNNIPWSDYNPSNYTRNNYASILTSVIEQYDYGNRDQTGIIKNSGTWMETNTSKSSNRLITLRATNDTTTTELIDVSEITEGGSGGTGKPFVEGEHTRLEIKRGMYDKYTPGFENFTQTSSSGKNYTTATGETVAVAEINDKERILGVTGNVGGANWIFSDTISHGRVNSEIARNTGEVDAVMLPKTTYYVNQVLNSDNEPMVYIMGHWNYPAGTTKKIYVTAKNVNKVSLFVDGNLVESITKGELELKDYLYTFNDVSYTNSADTYIEAIGYDGSDNPVANYRINKHGDPDHLEITALNGPTGLVANGSDILILDVKLLDANGNVCISYDGEVASNLVDFSTVLTDTNGITGEFLGGYNSSIPENTRTNHLYLEAGITRVFVRTTNNPGDISITASMTGVTSDTYSTTSIAQTLTNGLTTDANPTNTYTLNSANNDGMGNGTKLGTVIAKSTNNMYYIENFGYVGSAHDLNTIDDAVGVGTQIFSDYNVFITDIPYKFSNAEIIRLPYEDRDLTYSSLITFEVTRNATIFVARDSTIPVPNWLINDGYTRSIDPITGAYDTITVSNGKTYDVWKKAFTVSRTNNEIINTSISIGGYSDDGTTALTGGGQFVFVKETSKVANRTFFNQEFDDITTKQIMNGFGGYTPALNKTNCESSVVGGVWNSVSQTCSVNYGTTLSKDTIAGRTGLRLQDNKDPSIAYVTKHFSPLSEPFTLTFKAYIDNSKVNEWLRTFVSLEAPQSVTSLTNVPVEVYLFKKTDSNIINLKYKNNKGDTVDIPLTNVLADNWYTYKYHINPVTKKWMIKVYDESGITLICQTELYSFSRNNYLAFDESGTIINLNKLDHVTFATGQNVIYTTDFYIDDVSVVPDMDIGATNVIINSGEHNIVLDSETNSYIVLESDIPSESTISLTKTDDYYNHTITYDDINSVAEIDIENLNGDHYTFSIDYQANSALEGWHVEPTESVPDPDVTATSTVKDNKLSINMQDVASDNRLFIYKDFTPITSALNLSFDFFLTDSANFTQNDLEIFLTNGAMVDNSNNPSITTYDNVGIKSSIGISNSNNYLSVVEQVSGVSSTITDDTIVSKGEWHHIQYLVNVYAGTYSVLLDGTEIFSRIELFNPQISLDHIYISTGLYDTANLYIANVVHTEEGGYPIDGVQINQTYIPAFDNSIDTYTFYTDEPLTNETTIVLETNGFYVAEGSTITKNIQDQTITIIAMDNFDNSHTYTIHYDYLVNRPISIAALQALVDEANTYIESNYTYNTWGILQSEIEQAEYIIANSNIYVVKDYSKAYYELENAINNLLFLHTYSDYSTATVETISYSSNLKENNDVLFSFNKVLDNNKPVYFGEGEATFTSVPYRYMNAEYLVLTNRTYKNAVITLEPLQIIDILVFKDRDAGPLAVDGFTYTGEIAVSSDGVVYKIYSKTYGLQGDTTLENINLEFNTLVNNDVTNNANIIAFINHAKSGNDIFLNEDFDIYDAGLFDRAWTTEASVNVNYPNTNSFIGNVGDVDNYINLISRSIQAQASTYGLSMVYREMAKLHEQITFTFDFNMTTLSPFAPPTGSTFTNPANSMNRFNRTWLRNAPGDIGASVATVNTSDKQYSLVDGYVQNNNGSIVVTGNSTDGNINMSGSGVTVGSWNTVVYNMNLLTRKYTITYNGRTSAPLSMTNLVSGTSGSNANVTFANYVYFASRLQGPTDIKYKDVKVSPVNSNLYSDIEVNNTSIGSYHDLTKAYLYQIPDAIAFDNANATPIQGEMVNTDYLTDTSKAINPTISTTTNGTEKITSIEETYQSLSLGTYVRDYDVYYEVNTDSTSVDNTWSKEDLVVKLREAKNINPTYYEDTAELNIAILNAKNILANHRVEIGSAGSTNLTDVTGVYNALDDAITALTNVADVEFDYQAKIKPGKEYDNFTNEITNITNSSSLTVNFSLESRISGAYVYENMTHERYLVSDSSLPINTKITMIDMSGETDEFYYYIVDDASTSFALSNFIKADQSGNFENSYHLSNNIITANYSFILDFGTTSGIETSERTLSLDLYVVDNTQIPAVRRKVSNSEIASYGIFGGRRNLTAEITTDEVSYDASESIGLYTNFYIETPTIEDVTYVGTAMDDKILSARIVFYEAVYDAELGKYVMGEQIRIPRGATLTDEGVVYRLNSEGYFAISRNGPVESLSRNYTISPGFRNWIPGEYFMKTDFFTTYDGSNEIATSTTGLLATDIQQIQIQANPNCSIYAHVTDESNEQILLAGHSFPLYVDIDTICSFTNQDMHVTVSLERKNLPGNSDFAYTRINYQDYVNNSITTQYGEEAGIYHLLTYDYVFQPTTEHTYRYLANFNENLPAGMYRLTFDIRSGSTVQSDFITFVVK